VDGDVLGLLQRQRRQGWRRCRARCRPVGTADDHRGRTQKQRKSKSRHLRNGFSVRGVHRTGRGCPPACTVGQSRQTRESARAKVTVDSLPLEANAPCHPFAKSAAARAVPARCSAVAAPRACRPSGPPVRRPCRRCRTFDRLWIAAPSRRGRPWCRRASYAAVPRTSGRA